MKNEKDTIYSTGRLKVKSMQHVINKGYWGGEGEYIIISLLSPTRKSRFIDISTFLKCTLYIGKIKFSARMCDVFEHCLFF